MNDNNKLTKKERLRAMYVASYVVLISILVIFAILNPEFFGNVGDLLDKLKNAFSLFA